MDSSDELNVSIDAITDPTPGQKLRLAREAYGLTLDEVSTETNLSAKYLQALEADDFAALPGLAFARGYARRYAQLVHLDGAALIAEIDALAKCQGLNLMPALSATHPAIQSVSVGISRASVRKAHHVPALLFKLMAILKQVNFSQLLSLGSLLLLLLLLLGTLFWQGGKDTSMEPMADNGVLDIDADIQQQAPPELPVRPEIIPPPTVPASVVAPVEVSGIVQAAIEPTVVAPPAAPLPAAPTELPAPLPVPAAAIAPAAATAPLGIDTLSFSFTGKSWISVRDATGQELVYGLKNAGQAVTVTGKAPFSINIGNVHVTLLSRNGRGVNLKQYARGEIASFRLAPVSPPKP